MSKLLCLHAGVVSKKCPKVWREIWPKNLDALASKVLRVLSTNVKTFLQKRVRAASVKPRAPFATGGQLGLSWVMSDRRKAGRPSRVGAHGAHNNDHFFFAVCGDFLHFLTINYPPHSSRARSSRAPTSP